jgi:DNA primase
LKKKGREWVGLSPFNAEKSPSFFVNDPKGFFHDFSSGKHGDGFTFLMETEGLSFPEAVERLAAMAGVPMPVDSPEDRAREQKRASLTDVMGMATDYFQKQLAGPQGREARDYLARREISLAQQSLFRIGYATPGRHALRDALAAKGASVEQMIACGLLVHGEEITVPYDRFRDRIIFPICDRGGAVIAFGGRALAKDAQAKYLNSNETELYHKGSTLYNLHNARKAAHEAGTVIAVEGYVDVIALTAAGFSNSVATAGTALTEEQCQLMWRMAEEPILCFDGDRAGLKAAYRAVDTALPLIGPGKTMRFVLLAGGQDPDELLRAGGPGAVAEALAKPLPFVEMLWRREVEAGPLDTPERRAGLERRLRDLAARIQDAALRRHYEQDLQQRLSGLFAQEAPARSQRAWGARQNARFDARGAFSRSASGAVRVGASLAKSPLFTGATPSVSPRECVIFLIFVNHPSLLAEHIEELAAMEFRSAEAVQLRDTLVGCAAQGLVAESDFELAKTLAEAGLAPFVARLEGMAAHSTLWSVGKEAATADAAVSLRQVLSLHHGVSTLNKELRAVERRLAEDPCEEDAERLAAIRTQLSALDGTEAALDGFGSGSGRAKQSF